MKIVLNFDCNIVYNSHNFEADYAKISLKGMKLPNFLKKGYLLYSMLIEKISVRLSDYIFAVSDENKNNFVNAYFCNPRKILVINIGAEIPDKKSEPKNPYRKDKNEIFAVFHGSYDATHNKEAINLIRTQISKELRKYKKLKFVVAGKNLPKIKESNFISAGFVDNLPAFIASCDIAIVPLELGEGTKLKIFDYMASSLPIVTTVKGAEGMGLVNGKHAIITNHVDEKFIYAIEKLVENPELRKKLGSNARQLLEKEYHPNIIKDRVYTFFDKIIK
jgi:glycosyltransferase involved in cell wall biosynthesis